MYTLAGGFDFWSILIFVMAVLMVGMCPIGLVVPWRLKVLDSQPVKSKMDPVSIACDGF